MRVEANGIGINCRIDGPEGAPWVTFSTGIANDISLWDGQADALAADYRVLRYDWRGHGASEATAPPYTLDLLIGDIVGLWDALGVERSHLVGIGLGGVTAIGLAIAHGDRLLSVVPCACRAAPAPEYAAIWAPLIETARAGGIEAIVEPTTRRWFTDDFKAANPAVLDRVRTMIRTTSEPGYLGCIAALLTLDYADDLHRIAAPALFVSGGADHIGGPSALMQAMADSVPGARHATVPDAGHIVNIGNPDGFNRTLAEFLHTV